MTKLNAKSHRAPEQTDPGIYAALTTYPAGVFNDAERNHQCSLNLTLSGRCRFRYPEGGILVEAGDLVFAQPDTEMSWRVAKKESWCTVYAVFYPRPHWHELLSAREFGSGFTRLRIEDPAIFARVRHGLLAVHRIYARSVLHRDLWALLALERVLITLHAYLTHEKTMSDPRVNRAVRFMHDHYAEPLTNLDVARAAHSSVPHLASLFAQQMGVAPMKYLERFRLQKASEMLRFTNISVREILLACGYRDAAHFSNRFRSYSGLSPREFRKAPAARTTTAMPSHW